MVQGGDQSGPVLAVEPGSVDIGKLAYEGQYRNICKRYSRAEQKAMIGGQTIVQLMQEQGGLVAL